MMVWIINILRILALFCGLFCFYVSIFLYENQEGKIQNILENVWIKIDDYKQLFLSRQTMFMHEVARFTESIFNKLFGKKLFSWRSLAVSACYSIASVCLITSYKVYSHDEMVRNFIKSSDPNVTVMNSTYSEEYGKFIFPVLVFSTIGFFILASLPILIKKSEKLKLWFVSVLISVLLFASAFYITEYFGWIQFFQNIDNGGRARHTSLLWENAIIEINEELINRRDFILVMLSAYYMGIFFGFLSDALFIAITRKILQWATRLDSFLRILSIIILNCILALVLCLGPAFIGFGLAYIITGHSTGIFGQERIDHESHLTSTPYSAPIFAEGLQEAGYVSSLSNVITSLSATVFIALGVIFIAHRLFWPFIERTTYVLQRLGIAKRKKIFGTFGFILVGLAYGAVPSWLKDIIGNFI